MAGILAALAAVVASWAASVAGEAAEEGSCKLDVAGKCEAPRTGSVAREGGSRLLPPCQEEYALEELVARAPEWCNSSLVPAEKRLPKKLQGLFWLKGLPLSDVAACFSTGTWDQETLTATLTVWRDFIWQDSLLTRTLVGTVYNAEFKYLIKFKDANLTDADIKPTGNLLFSPVVTTFAKVAEFPFIESPGGKPGDRWSRPSYFGIGDFKVLTNEYEAWRVLDGDSQPVPEQVEHMEKLLGRKLRGSKILRFSDECLAGDGVGSEPSPASARPAPVCKDGALLAVKGQPALGLRHLDLKESTPFAQLSDGHCMVEYSVVCEVGVVSVKVDSHCSPGAVPPGPSGGSAEHGWEVCASPGAELRLRQPVVDLTWDVEMPEQTHVDGCLEVMASGERPELATVRGDLASQAAALAGRKRAVGGCPTFRKPEDRPERGKDFAVGGHGPVFSSFVRNLQREQSRRARQWKRTPPGANLSFVESAKDAVGLTVHLTFMGVAAQQNRSIYFGTLAEANCGEPSPFVDGPVVYRYAEVAGAIADPQQRRIYATAATMQTDSCFQTTLPLFMSSGSPEHTQVRRLLDAAGFDRMHTAPLPDVASLQAPLWRRALGMTTPSEEEVGRLVLPLVMEGIWKKQPSKEEVEALLPYLKYGKTCILGKRGKSAGLLFSGRVEAMRKTAADFAKGSPTAKTMAELLAKEDYQKLRQLLEANAAGKAASDLLVENTVDALLFAGLLGTTDMAHKCVVSQHKDRHRIRLFRKDPTAYLHELMRMDSAVTSFTTATKDVQNWKLEGVDVELPHGTPVQMVLATANRDPAVFAEPEAFDPDRPDIMEMVSWNGKLRDVIGRNYSGAPRFCPGYHLSVKVASAVCGKLTEGLALWNEGPADEVLSGLVRILRPGPLKNRQGTVSYYDFDKKKHCVIDRFKVGASLGCYDRSELKLVKQKAVAKTLSEELETCPPFTIPLVNMLAHVAVRGYQAGSFEFLESIFVKATGSELMTPDWAGDFVVAAYAGVVHMSLRLYAARHADSVMVPERMGLVETFRVGHITAPNADIDHPHFMPIEWYIPQSIWDAAFLPGLNCFQGALRTMPWDDMLEDDDEVDGKNSWSTILANAHRHYARKKDWVLSFYLPYHGADGVGVWPRSEFDLAQLYLKADMWDDGLERAIAFGLIGAHRVKTADREFRGQRLPFVVELNSFSALEVRPKFGRYGADLYFDADCLPTLIVTPDGREVTRGDKDWQYWKFVWRSSLITVITLVDHLHLAHFRAANVLATASRKTLSPKHPMRRALTVFTFGTIFVNLNAMHTLIGPGHLLHRATPFKEFEALSDLVPTTLPLIEDQHKALLDDEEFAKLPKELQDAPYYADGRLLVKAMRRLVDKYFYIYRNEICNSNGKVTDEELIRFREELMAENTESHYASSLSRNVTCANMHLGMLAFLWTVTGWHRHVGTVGDYYADPELASFSWRDGEAHSRPKQHMLMSVVAAFTGTEQPKLAEDYSHVFRGIDHEEEAVKVWDDFRKELKLVHDEIAKRNEKRMQTWGFKNIHADPNVVECSVAV